MDTEPNGDKMTDEIKKTVENGERIGVIGSPSSTANITVDVLGTAMNKKLVGNLCIFGYQQDGLDHFALGQIAEISMRNIWAEDPTMRGLIRQRGNVPPITEKQDVHVADMITSAVFSVNNDKIGQSILGTVPSTGTDVKLIDEKIMDRLFFDYKSKLFYLGKVYGTNIKMPMWLHHFGSKESGGAGEAYHIGIFGKTGSGKSRLAEMMMLGYAKHKDMSILILDPQSQFSQDLGSEGSKIKEVLAKIGKPVKIFHIKNVVLDNPTIFRDILAISNFWEGLVRSEEYRIKAGDVMWEYLKNLMKSEEINLFQMYKKEQFQIIWDKIFSNESYLGRVYSKAYAKEFKEALDQEGAFDSYYERWVRVAKLFTGDGRGTTTTAITVNKLITEQFFVSQGAKPIVVVDLSKEGAPEGVLWDERIQALIINRILEKLTQVAEEYYKKDALLNSLVIIDEAHRLAQREKTEEPEFELVKQTLIDAVRTTRKYGLGWMFVSQTLSSLSRDIIDQLRVQVFGFGLAWGIERNALRELIGGQEEVMNLYQSFKDPQTFLNDKPKWQFMAKGPISPLSFAESPLFFDALDLFGDFLTINFP